MLIFSNANTDLGLSPKVLAKLKMQSFLSGVEKKETKLVKTASFDSTAASDQVLRTFAKALSEMNIKTEIDLGELFKRIFAASAEKPASREEVIKIASKEIKDSHYQFDLAKEVVEKNGKRMFMVSAYLRDAYLGKYLIKRNFFFLGDNERSANKTYEEIEDSVKSVKQKYYKDSMTVKDMTTEIFEKLQSVKSDVELPENDIGTTVKRS